MDENEDRFVDVDTAAELISVSAITLRQWISKKKVPYYKLPGSNLVRLRISQLLSWMEQGFHPAGGEYGKDKEKKR